MSERKALAVWKWGCESGVRMFARSILYVLAAVLLSASPSPAAPPQVVPKDPGRQPATSSAAGSEELRWLHTELFSVQIPNSWSEVTGERLRVVREHAELVAREIFPPDLSSGAPPERVLWSSAYEAADRSTRLFLFISEIPPPSGPGRPYIERKVLGYADWQRAQAMVEKIRVSEVEELNGMPAVEVILDLPEGSTLYTVNVWTSVYRDRVGTVVAVTNAGALAQAREAVVRLVSSVRPSKKVMAAQQPVGPRVWLRDTLWASSTGLPSDALLKRIMIILICFSFCFAVSLRLIYEAAVVWYRWHNMEDRVVEMARRAARDVLRLGQFYSQRVVLTCALFSMTVTTAALIWLTAP